MPVPFDDSLTASSQSVFAILKENAEWFSICFTDHRRIVVPTSEIDKTANVAEHFAKSVGVMPGNGKGTDSTRAVAAYCS